MFEVSELQLQLWPLHCCCSAIAPIPALYLNTAPLTTPALALTSPACLVFHTTIASAQAEQQADSSHPQATQAGPAAEAADTDAPPYTLKFSNCMGDVRMQSKWPDTEGESVLYFTAQWEQDGGGVYDVAKLTHPQACNCFQSVSQSVTIILILLIASPPMMSACFIFVGCQRRLCCCLPSMCPSVFTGLCLKLVCYSQL